MDIAYIATVLGVVLVSMSLHEVAHGFVAYYLGDDTAYHLGRLSFNPLKHIDPFLTIILPIVLAISHLPIFGGAKPVPFNPSRLRYGEWGVALVGIAGPLVNFLIAFVAFGVLVVTGMATTSTAGNLLMIIVMVNLGFFVFNILPIPPLDGSRVAYALAPDFIRRAMEAVERGGLMIIFIIVLLASSVIASFMGTAIRFILELFIAIFGLAG